MKKGFTPEELEELRRFDEMIDNEPMRDEDYKLSDFVDDLLFPHLVQKREKSAAKDASQKAATIESGEIDKVREKARKYQEENREKIKARRAAYYQKNKERIAAHQKAYAESKKAAKAAAKESGVYVTTYQRGSLAAC